MRMINNNVDLQRRLGSEVMEEPVVEEDVVHGADFWDIVFYVCVASCGIIITLLTFLYAMYVCHYCRGDQPPVFNILNLTIPALTLEH